MKDIDKTLNTFNAEVMTAHQWIEALIVNHPNPQNVLTSFRAGIESLCQNAPTGIDPENIIELRAHAEQQLLAVGMRITSNESR